MISKFILIILCWGFFLITLESIPLSSSFKIDDKFNKYNHNNKNLLSKKGSGFLLSSKNGKSKAGVRANLSRLYTKNTLSTSSSPKNDAASLKVFIENLLEGKSLSQDEAETAWSAILHGANPEQVAALLVLLRKKGESSEEISGMVKAMMQVCNKISLGNMDLLDIVGTGGDGAHTINISTAAIILAAACGCKVAKGGNRSVSSQCGSADVLEALGVNVELQPEQVASCVKECGIGFMFAPVNHPSMKAVAPIRKSLGIRTAFNILGPLCNAAGAQHIVLGVFHEDLLELMANALIKLGNIEHAMVVHGCGLDEISPLGASKIIEIKNINPKSSSTKKYIKNVMIFDPLDVDIPRCTISDLQGGDATKNAHLLRETLKSGSFSNAKRDAVVLNAGCALYVYKKAETMEKGIEIARKALESGAALEKLDEWIVTSKFL